MIRDNKVLPRMDSSARNNDDNTNTTNNMNNNDDNTNKKHITLPAQAAEQDTLLTKLDNKYIKEEFAGNYVFLGACFCPCLFLGHLESKVQREESMWCSCCATSCPRFTFGTTGCQTCCLTAFFCTLGWPCSPCLTCYLNSKSTSISNIYDRDVKRTCCDAPLLWPKTVLQQVLLHEQLDKEGRLFYDWTLEKDVQQSLQRERFDMEATAVLIVGGSRVGKTDLLMKLCHRTLYEKRENTFENNEVRVGFRPMSISNSAVSSLEFWDIPTLHLQSIHTIRAKVAYVLLMFDVTRVDSLKEMQTIYKDIQETMPEMVNEAVFVVIAGKNDHLYYKTTAEGRWEMDPHQATLAQGAAWASGKQMSLLSTATPFNIGVNDILKMVQASAVPNI